MDSTFFFRKGCNFVKNAFIYEKKIVFLLLIYYLAFIDLLLLFCYIYSDKGVNL